MAQSVSKQRVYAVILNDRNEPRQQTLRIDLSKISPGARAKAITELTENKTLSPGVLVDVTVPAYGIKVYAVDL